jgi:hypothetical protein
MSLKDLKMTSVQISMTHRDMLKKYCEEYGFNMSAFLQKLIEEKTKPYKDDGKSCFTGKGRPVKGNTPFGIYDNVDCFVSDCYDCMGWAAKKLGYPVVDIELCDLQFYGAYEEAVYEYMVRRPTKPDLLKSGSERYSNISDQGKIWIKKYYLALCKECLGMIRQKYQVLPSPGGDVMLDGRELTLEARMDKEILLRELTQ